MHTVSRLGRMQVSLKQTNAKVKINDYKLFMWCSTSLNIAGIWVSHTENVICCTL